MRKSIFNQIILQVILIALIVIMLYPLAMAVWCAVKTTYNYDLTKWYPTFPLQINNLTVAWNACRRFILNTVFVGIVATVASLILSSLAAYAFAKIDFPGNKIFFSAMMSLMMIPGVLTLVPSHMLYCKLNMYNTYLALILPTALNGSVFGVFLLVSFFKGIPESLFEAARLDGASEARCFMVIAMPLCKAILGTLAIMKIIGVWNDYLWPQIIIRDMDKQLISSGLAFMFTGMYASNMPITYAGYLLASIPIILLFSVTSKFYIEGLMTSGLKL